ncbi:MgtC/SapB family protein [Eubacteriales bacterium OttesenSCG-928-G02]|nr:MgtC/SapB family protein [Eubacteriales bacterium OttesenSCG-928-G02]
MEQIMIFLREFNVYTTIIRLFLALLGGGIIGLEREKNGHPAGLRTHILVSLGSAMTVMVGLFSVRVLGIASDPLRVGAQVISGIGFLGVGTILITERRNVKGLTTAAGLWSTASIGLAFGIGFYEGAFIALIIVSLVMIGFKSIDYKLFKKNGMYRIYFEIDDAHHLNEVILWIEEAGILTEQYEVQAPRTNLEGAIGIEATVKLQKNVDPETIIEELNKMEHIIFTINLK